ncbi:MAG: hypothetical protein HKN49_09315 [Gammaproteobacteria bacterium]|nr:hypothetical protein [Gammaproteobacteria bacterium]
MSEPLSNRRIAVPTFKEAILAAIEKLLYPLAEIIVRSGVMVRDVNVILERACVEVAKKKLEKENRQTLTRVALITGIDRKKVRRYSRELESPDRYELERQTDVITMVLSKWHTEKPYLDDDGLPRPLTRFGPGPCIRDLVETYGKDLSTRVIVSEMLHAKCLYEEDGVFIPKTRGYFPAKASAEVVNIFGVAVRDLIETMNYNLLLKRTRKDGRFQKSAIVEVPESQLTDCREEIERRMDECLNDIDNYLTIKRASLAEGEATVRLGAGCYEIQSEGGVHETK